MNESPSFKKETNEDVREIAEREVRKIEHEVDELRYKLNEILANLNAQDLKAKEDYKKNPNQPVDQKILDTIDSLHSERTELEQQIEKKEGGLSQLRIALKKD